MTILEQRFMESVPNSLRDIAKSLEKLAEVTTKPVVSEPRKMWLIQESRFTTEDNNLWMGCDKFSDKDAALVAFEKSRKNAYKECRWGAEWDGDDPVCEYDVNEVFSGTHYEVSSDAYNGFFVKIDLLEITL